MKTTWLVFSGVCLAVLVGAPGCADPKDQKIKDLTDERDRLRNELDNRDRMLADNSQREQDAQRTIEQLRRQLAEAEKRTPAEGEGGWVNMPGFDMISIPGEVLFDSGKATLRPTGRSKLDQIASDIVTRYPDREIYVFGHTDTDPIRKSGWKDNWELGAERALTVCRYLISQGVSPRNIVQASCGEHRPRDANTSEAGKQRNRRVEFYAVERTTGARPAESSGAAAP